MWDLFGGSALESLVLRPGVEELGGGVEGGRGELLVVDVVEVVDVVSSHHEEESA